MKKMLSVILPLMVILSVLSQAQSPSSQIEEIQLACVNPSYIIADDFNQDGYPDIAVACHSCDAIAVIPNGKKTCPAVFGVPVYWQLNDSPVALASGRFIDKPSGKNFPYTTVFPNIAFVTQYLPAVGRMSPLNPTGAFLTFKNGRLDLAAVPGPIATLTHLAVGDFNNDGNDDIMVLDRIKPQIWGYFSVRGTPTPAVTPQGSAGNTSTGPISLPAGVTRAQFLVTADFDRDGWLDLAVAAEGRIFFYRNKGGTFALVTDGQGKPLSIVVGTNVTGMATADFNRDGYVDLVAVDPDFGALAIILNRGCSSEDCWDLELWKRIKKDGGPFFVAVFDCDRNGLPDIAVAERDANRVEIILTRLIGTQSTTRPDPCTHTVLPPELTDQIDLIPTFDISVGPTPMSLAIADYDLNGMQDIAVILGGADGTTDPDSAPEVQVIYNPCCCPNCAGEKPCCPAEIEPPQKCEEDGDTKKGK